VNRREFRRKARRKRPYGGNFDRVQHDVLARGMRVEVFGERAFPVEILVSSAVIDEVSLPPPELHAGVGVRRVLGTAKWHPGDCEVGSRRLFPLDLVFPADPRRVVAELPDQPGKGHVDFLMPRDVILS